MKHAFGNVGGGKGSDTAYKNGYRKYWWNKTTDKLAIATRAHALQWRDQYKEVIKTLRAAGGKANDILARPIAAVGYTAGAGKRATDYAKGTNSNKLQALLGAFAKSKKLGQKAQKLDIELEFTNLAVAIGPEEVSTNEEMFSLLAAGFTHVGGVNGAAAGVQVASSTRLSIQSYNLVSERAQRMVNRRRQWLAEKVSNLTSKAVVASANHTVLGQGSPR